MHSAQVGCKTILMVKPLGLHECVQEGNWNKEETDVISEYA